MKVNGRRLASERRASTRPRVVMAMVATAALLLRGVNANGQSAENVAVIINDNSPDSQRVGDYYARARSLPASNVFRIRTSVEETVDRATFTRTIAQPIQTAIARSSLQDRILYLVITKGVPLRVAGSAGVNTTAASVDSELTLLYRQMSGQPMVANGRVENPYYLAERPLKEARRFTHKDYEIYLVSRLDAFTVEEAIALIDRAGSPQRDGVIVLDQRDALVNRTGEEWLEAASKRLAAEGHADQVLLETTLKPARDVKPVIGYFSWGSTDPQNRVRSVGMGFAPGAIAASYVSSDARTFRQPPETWLPSVDVNRSTWFAGSPESLIGDLIREGVTGVAGHVSDPLLDSVIRPQILFPAYLSGFNLIESFYLAMPHLSWQTVVIGDPLCAPFQSKILTRSDIEGGVDNATELPTLFSKRRVQVILALNRGTPESAAAAYVKGQTLLGRGDNRGGRAAFDEAVRLARGFGAAWLQLATLDEQEQQFDAAIDKYKRILEIQPNHVVALNNLAYGLAVRQQMPAQGLPFAQRAVARAPKDPMVLETLAWIQYLVGDQASAAKSMTEVARANLNVPDAHVHAAIVFAAVGNRATAENELATALKLNPALETSDDVKQIRAQLAKLGAGK